MTPPRASVIIPAYNAAGTIAAQLEALCEQRGAPAFEVIVVANRCTDDTVRISETFRGRLDLSVLQADDKGSAAYARNRGASQARAPLLLFCDADDRVGETWVAGMVDALGSGQADIVGGLIEVNRDGLPDWIYRWRYASVDRQCVHVSQKTMAFAISASLGTRAEAFDDVGGFDESFNGAGTEDIDLCFRLLRRGFRIGAAPQAVISYEPRRTLRSVIHQVRNYSRGGLQFAAQEGRLDGDRPASGSGVIRTTARWLVRRREFHPLLYIGLAIAHIDRRRLYRELQRSSEVRSVTTPTHHDFVAGLAIPVIGGLAFAATRRQDAHWYSTDGLEPLSLSVLETFLEPGSIVVDVGANIGLFSIAAAKIVGPSGRVTAFEPGDRPREVLMANLERHRVADRVDVRPEAVGGSGGRAVFRDYENTLVSGFGPAPAGYSPGRLISERDVDVVGLSDVVPGPVDLLKIDVEGFEIDVMTGARELIRRSPRLVVLMEVNPTSLAAVGRSPHELFDVLPDDEWDVWLLDERAGSSLADAPRVDRINLRDHLPADDTWYANLLAVKKGRT